MDLEALPYVNWIFWAALTSGSLLVIGGTELLRELEWMKQIFGRDFEPTHYRMLIFGLAMVLVMIWKPRGVISTRMPSIFLRQRRAVRGDLVGEGHG